MLHSQTTPIPFKCLQKPVLLKFAINLDTVQKKGKQMFIKEMIHFFHCQFYACWILVLVLRSSTFSFTDPHSLPKSIHYFFLSLRLQLPVCNSVQWAGRTSIFSLPIPWWLFGERHTRSRKSSACFLDIVASIYMISSWSLWRSFNTEIPLRKHNCQWQNKFKHGNTKSQIYLANTPT